LLRIDKECYIEYHKKVKVVFFITFGKRVQSVEDSELV